MSPTTCDRTGTMKVLFDAESLKLLGVHVIGENAAELNGLNKL